MKKNLLLPIVAALVLAAAVYAYEWQEPLWPPLEGNVSVPLNVSEIGQIKQGGLILNTDGAEIGLIIDQGNVGIGTQDPQKTLDVAGGVEALDFRFTPTSVPEPEEGRLFWNSATKALYFHNGTKWQKFTGIEETFCMDWESGVTDDPNCGLSIDCSGWYEQTGVEGVDETEYCWNHEDIITDRCEGVDDCKDANTSDCNGQDRDEQVYSCGTCRYIPDDLNYCQDSIRGACVNYPQNTPCADGKCCGGECVPEDSVVVGSWAGSFPMPCAQVCAQRGAQCLGIGTDQCASNGLFGQVYCEYEGGSPHCGMLIVNGTCVSAMNAMYCDSVYCHDETNCRCSQ